MDFNDTAEQAAFRAEAQAWLAEHAPAHEVDPTRVAQVDNPEDLARAKIWQATKADAGWAGLHWPVEYGGRGLGALHSIIWSTEEQQYSVPQGALFGIGLNFCAPTMMAYATEAQKRRHLPPMLRGDEVWCQLFSEPGAGSDLAGLRTRARRDGDDWMINGQKIWNTYAHLADFGILVTRHDPTLQKHKGLTYFFVDMHSPGVEPRPIRQIAGSSDFNEVFLTNVRIPDANRLGEIGAGWQVAITTLMNERQGATSANSLPDFRHALALAREVRLENGPALDDPVVRERLADWYVETQGLKLISWRSLTALSRGAQPGPEASIRKLVAAAKRQSIASFGMDLLDMGGVLQDQGPLDGMMQQAFLHSPAGRIAGGTDEILLNILAERVLGLPGDIRVDRDVAFEDIPVGR